LRGRKLPIKVLILIVTAVGLGGLIEPMISPDRHEAGIAADASAPVAPSVTAFAAHHHHDGPGASGPSTAALAAQLAEAREVAARWPTAATARADGWTLAARYSSHLGAHYMHFADIDGVFDIRHPEMLLYDGNAPTSRIVGVTYYVLYTRPSGFTGSADHWHQHLNVCIGPAGPLVGADGVGICATTNVRPVGEWAWMLHAWVVPGWTSPQGVFSTENQVLP
jgi:hypothetical protein